MIFVFARSNVRAKIGTQNIAQFGKASLGTSSGPTPPPVSTAIFSVSGLTAQALFLPTVGVSLPWAGIEQRTN